MTTAMAVLTVILAIVSIYISIRAVRKIWREDEANIRVIPTRYPDKTVTGHPFRTNSPPPDLVASTAQAIKDLAESGPGIPFARTEKRYVIQTNGTYSPHPMFSGENAKCPKCGNHGHNHIKQRYQANKNLIERECHTIWDGCGYTWFETPIDASEAK